MRGLQDLGGPAWTDRTQRHGIEQTNQSTNLQYSEFNIAQSTCAWQEMAMTACDGPIIP